MDGSWLFRTGSDRKSHEQSRDPTSRVAGRQGVGWSRKHVLTGQRGVESVSHAGIKGVARRQDVGE